MSPEVLNGKPYTKAADIYSFGMITYELITGERPFGERSHDRNLVLDIYKGERPMIPNTIPKLLLKNVGILLQKTDQLLRDL